MSYQQLVEQHHKSTFTDNVKMVAQQKSNPFEAAVTTVPAKGEAQSVADLVGAKEARRGTDRDRSNPDDPSPRSRRWLIRPEAIETGEYIDREDKWDAAMDPTSVLFQNNMKAVIRGRADALLGVQKVDGVYIPGLGGIFGNAYEGKAPSAGTALPSAQIIPAGTTGLTLDKLRTAKKTLKKADFGLEDDDQLYAAISPDEEDDLLQLAVDSGNALNAFTIEQLKSGKPTPLLGITWIVTNRIPQDAAGDNMCAIWSKANIIAGEWQGIEGDIWNDSSKKNLPYIYVSSVIDATRVEDSGVIVVTAKRT